jgi:hypothetical protein
MPQPMDAVQFKLGTRPIELDMVGEYETDLVSVIVDHVVIGTFPREMASHHYRTALETARRIGRREF